MRKSGILIWLLTALFFVDAFAAEPKAHEFRKTYQTTAGVVVFDHAAHAMGRVKDCAFCHSGLKTFGGKMNELFAHTFCKKCHESGHGPTECNGCHKAE